MPIRACRAETPAGRPRANPAVAAAGGDQSGGRGVDSIRPSAGDRALEFVGTGALLATVYMMRARWNGDRLGGSRHFAEGDRSGR
jgi:hypothetical protein